MMTDKTYTLAFYGDWLMATVVDGEDAMMDASLSELLPHFAEEDREEILRGLTYVSGLTLYASRADAEDDGAEVVYSGQDAGAMRDEKGRQAMAAGRKPRAA